MHAWQYVLITTAHEKLSGVLSRIPCRGIVVYALEAASQALDGAEFTNLLRTTQTGECPVLLIGRLPEIEEHLTTAGRPVLTRVTFDPLDCKAIFKSWQNRGRAKAAGATR